MDKFTVLYESTHWDEQMVIENVNSVMSLENDQCVVNSDNGTFILTKGQGYGIRILLGRYMGGK